MEHGLAITLDHFTTRAQQERALNLLQFKLDVLWSLADAISYAYDYGQVPHVGIADQSISHKGML